MAVLRNHPVTRLSSDPIEGTPAGDVGIGAYDGIILAYLPKLDRVPMEIPLSGDQNAALYVVDGMGLDIKDDTERPVKWWRVRNACREARLEMPEPVWHGPAQELSYERLHAIMERHNPMREGSLHMRRYDRGPWINCETLEEKE